MCVLYIVQSNVSSDCVTLISVALSAWSILSQFLIHECKLFIPYFKSRSYLPSNLIFLWLVLPMCLLLVPLLSDYVVDTSCSVLPQTFKKARPPGLSKWLSSLFWAPDDTADSYVHYPLTLGPNGSFLFLLFRNPSSFLLSLLPQQLRCVWPSLAFYKGTGD